MKRSRIFFITLGLAFLLPASVWAGCCTVMTTVPQTGSLQTVYINTNTAEECTNRNGINTRATYAPDQISIENQKCQPVSSQNNTIAQPAAKPLIPQLQVSIPGFKGFSEVKCDEENPQCSTPWLAEYIRGLYDYGLILLGLISIIAIMIGGVIRLTAGGNRSQIGAANDIIKGSLMGMILAVASYVILFLLNPNLTVLPILKVGRIARQELPEILPPEDLTERYTSSSLPDTNLGTSSGRYKIPILYQGRFRDLDRGIARSGCGPTSLTMVLNYYGIKKSVPDIATEAQRNENWVGGTDSECGGWRGGMSGFQTILDKYGLKYRTGDSFDAIKSLLQYGPVIASIGGGSGCAFTGDGHYVVFTGFSNGNFYTNDPNEGNLDGSSRGPSTQVISEADAKRGCSINAGVIAVYR